MSDTVHGTPESNAPVPRPPEPSGIPRTIGILSIVFGGLTTLQSLSSVLFAGRPFLMRNQRAMAGHLIELTRRVAPYAQTEGGVMLIMSVALLVIGIGLVGYREAARKAAIVWSIVA